MAPQVGKEARDERSSLRRPSDVTASKHVACSAWEHVYRFTVLVLSWYCLRMLSLGTREQRVPSKWRPWVVAALAAAMPTLWQLLRITLRALTALAARAIAGADESCRA